MGNLNTDLFLIDTKSANKHIVYSPLRGMAFFANDKAVQTTYKYLNGERLSAAEQKSELFNHLQKLEEIDVQIPQGKNNINGISEIVVILTQACNLVCSYCYAQESRAKDTLNSIKLKQVIDNSFNLETNKTRRFSFIGGGEPTVAWGKFKTSVEYINFLANKNRVSVVITLTTNATLLTAKRIKWLKENNVKVGVSFDILPQIQNKQRPFNKGNGDSHKIIDNTIRNLLASGFSVRLRATITNDCVNLMSKMVRYVSNNYPRVRNLHFEPVSDFDELSNVDYYDKFTESFFDSMKIGKELGINVYNSITRSFETIKTRFCKGEFCITPLGAIVFCHRISSNKEKGFNHFKYGIIDDEIKVDSVALSNIVSFAEEKMSACSNCFAKWHCAGGCAANRFLLTDRQKKEYCNFFRTNIIKILTLKLKGKYYGNN